MTNHKHDYNHEHDDCNCRDRDGCGCDHCAENTNFDLHSSRERKGFMEEHKRDMISLIVGAVLMVIGLITEHLLAAPVTYCTVLLVCLIAYIILGGKVLVASVRNIRHGEVFDENLLMSIATIAAFCIGDFPEAVGVMLFYRIGEMFEDISVDRSRDQIIKAVDMRPDTVKLISKAGDRGTETLSVKGEDPGKSASPVQFEELPARQSFVGDILLIEPGDRIPLDGKVIFGTGQIDTSVVTGESVPILVKNGDDVLSGCINMRGQFHLEVKAPLAESMVSRILDSVEHAAASKPKIDRFITKFAKIYTPIVVTLAVLVAILPPLVTIYAGGSDGDIMYVDPAGLWKQWILTAVTFLVISCPCAMVISVPLAYFLGIGGASRKGILFKSGLALEALRKVRIVAMDKTGTITKGVVEDKGLLEVSEPDKNFEAEFAKKTVSGDEPKEDAASGISWLKSLGIIPAMLTGDKKKRSKVIGRQVGIGEENIRSELLPQDKLDALMGLRREHGAIMFVGDGINDAPVLAGADVGAAMGTGADAAIEAADIVFMNSGIEAIPESIRTARKTGSIAIQNIVLALGIKLIIIILGLLGFANIWLAVFADTGVAMLCILNSLRLLKKS